MVDMQLNTLDLSNFTSAEMKEVKTYFDGTRAKKLAKLKKEREKKKVLQNAGKRLIFLNKLKQHMKDDDAKFDNLDIIKKRTDTFRVKNKGILAKVKKQKEKAQRQMIDLNQPKFKKLDKFISGKLFIKYLSKKYIIQSILKTILSFCSNNFHWLCYLMMIINHMMSSSLLTILYPLSIFCYALLEYPRPKKFYWTFCLIYTVILLSIKFIVNLKIFKNTALEEALSVLYNYKIGFKVYESNFSSEFFMYILYDALVLIFLLINDYLLVSKGIWNKREQEIENIYQAMERVAKTKDLEINTSKEIKEFNSKFLNPYKLDKLDKIEISEKETFRFNKYLNLDDYNKRPHSVYNKNARKTKGINLKKSKLKKTSVGLIKGKSLDDDNIVYNRKEKVSKNKEESKEKKQKEDKKKEENKNEELNEEIKYDESKRKYFEKLFPKARNEKPGSEYYASYAISMLFIIIIILIFYTRMVQDKTYGSVEIDTKQFSGEMVIVLLIHVFILVYDRILYISQNRNNL
jgi:hypothetical protein